MSLTSYRAPPPRDNPLRAFSKAAETALANAARRRSIRSGGLLRRQPLANARGRGGCVPTRARFGKARQAGFQDIIVAESAKSRPHGAKPAIGSAVATS